MNMLTGAGVLAENKLFSTLDTRTRQWQIKSKDEGGRMKDERKTGTHSDSSFILHPSSLSMASVPAQRHGRVHPRPAASPRCLVQGDAGRDAPGPPPAARRRRQQPNGRGSDPLGERRTQGNRLRRAADAAGAEQDRSRAGPVVLAGVAATPPASRGDQCRDAAGVGRIKQKAVAEEIAADFSDAIVETAAGNGKVLAYLAAHAEIYRHDCDDENRVTVHCSLPRHLLHHIQGPDVKVRFLNGASEPKA